MVTETIDTEPAVAPYIPTGEGMRKLQAAIAGRQIAEQGTVSIPPTEDDYAAFAEEGLSDQRVAEAMVRTFGADLRYVAERR